MSDQTANDVQAALGGQVAETPTGIGMVPPTPGPAATSLPVQFPQPQQPVPQQFAQPVQQPQVQPPVSQFPQQVQQPMAQPQVSAVQPPQQMQQPQVQQVAPNAAGAVPFVNPDPSQGINEPIMYDPNTGQPIPVVAPANQPAPISPQVAAQEQEQRELQEPPTVQELAEAANTLRATQPGISGQKIAALLDRVAEARIQSDNAQQGQVPQQFQQQFQQQPQGQFVTH